LRRLRLDRTWWKSDRCWKLFLQVYLRTVHVNRWQQPIDRLLWKSSLVDWWIYRTPDERRRR
jgi:hypothetical protein